MLKKTNDITRQIGQKIRERREFLNLKQHELARLLGITAQQMSKYELGSNKVPANRLYEMCKILSVPSTFFYEELEPISILAKDSRICLAWDIMVGQKVEVELSNIQGIITNVKIREESR